MTYPDYDFFNELEVDRFLLNRKKLFKEHRELLKNPEIRKLFNIVMDQIDLKIKYYMNGLIEHYRIKLQTQTSSLKDFIAKVEIIDDQLKAHAIGVQNVYEEFKKFKEAND